MVCENILTTPPLPFLVKDGAFRHNIDYVTVFKEILNLKGHPNCTTGDGDFDEWVDFAVWWSCIRKGLLLQPAQHACYLTI